MKIGRTAQLILGLGIAGAGLYFFLRNVDMSKLKSELSETSAIDLALCAGLAVLTLALRSIRWRMLLPDIPGTNKNNLFSHVMISYMVNSVVPARAGEAVRALLLWRKNGYSPAVSIGSLIVERILDILVFMTFFVLPIFLLPTLAEFRRWAYVISAFIAGILVFFVLFAAFDKAITRLALHLISIFPERFRAGAREIGKQLATTLHWLTNPRRVASVVVLSVLTTACYPLMMIILLEKAGSFGFLEGMFSQAFAALGAAIPLAPGYVGTLHATLQYGLSLLGVKPEPAAALAILYHATNMIPITIIGLIYFFRTDMTFRQVTEAKQQLND
ncbi:MAG: flippase-like domain-containing protein [Chitinivibrionales bacterium]|nr:flippase-like domain-containing protein [Chitinivibrionales bacterium]MBD3356920.1 flippase-like domain-containing protein [Chitinivibrionales bacterium]